MNFAFENKKTHDSIIMADLRRLYNVATRDPPLEPHDMDGLRAGPCDPVDSQNWSQIHYMIRWFHNLSRPAQTATRSFAGQVQPGDCVYFGVPAAAIAIADRTPHPRAQ